MSIYLGDAINALLAAFQGSTALSGVTISLDVPSAINESQFVIVGHDGSLEPDGSLSPITEAGAFTTKFAYTGNPPGQQEDGTVNCVAVCQTGDATLLAAQITAVEAVLTACSAAASDLLTSGGIQFETVQGAHLWTRQAGAGCAAEIAFTITYSAPFGG
jgi:hypothetical protein